MIEWRDVPLEAVQWPPDRHLCLLSLLDCLPLLVTLAVGCPRDQKSKPVKALTN